MKKCRYMLTARFADAFDGISVIEAKSEVFTLKDKRNKQYEKHYPPTLSDDVLRLDNISKKGPYVKRLKDKNIITVKNFLTEHFKNHQRLEEILNMPKKKLNRTITHALTCEGLEDKYIYYLPGSQQQMGIVLNAVGKLFGVISKCHFIPIGSLPETQEDDAGKSVASALENWGDVVRYNEHSLYSTSTHLVSHDYTPSIAGYDNAQKFISSQIFLPPAVLMGTSQIIGAYESYDHMQSTNSRAKAVLPSFLFGTSNVNGKYGLVPPIAPYANGTLSDIFIGTSLATGVYSGPPNLFDMEFGTSNDFLDQMIQDPNFSIDEYYGPDERLKKDISNVWFREWGKMIFVLRFSCRMKMKKPGRVQKRLKFN